MFYTHTDKFLATPSLIIAPHPPSHHHHHLSLAPSPPLSLARSFPSLSLPPSLRIRPSLFLSLARSGFGSLHSFSLSHLAHAHFAGSRSLPSLLCPSLTPRPSLALAPSPQALAFSSCSCSLLLPPSPPLLLALPPLTSASRSKEQARQAPCSGPEGRRASERRRVSEGRRASERRRVSEGRRASEPARGGGPARGEGMGQAMAGAVTRGGGGGPLRGGVGTRGRRARGEGAAATGGWMPPQGGRRGGRREGGREGRSESGRDGKTDPRQAPRLAGGAGGASGQDEKTGRRGIGASETEGNTVDEGGGAG